MLTRLSKGFGFSDLLKLRMDKRKGKAEGSCVQIDAQRRRLREGSLDVRTVHQPVQCRRDPLAFIYVSKSSKTASIRFGALAG